MPELYSSPTFAQLLQQFFVERLMQQRNASPRLSKPTEVPPKFRLP
jgi:hypothetical protein